MPKNKIKSREEIISILSELRSKNPNLKIVTTNGAFDILHAGHVASLEFAKNQGDLLIVGLNSDSSIKKYKSALRPIIPQKERAEMLAALEVVDYITIFDETDPRDLLASIKPHFHIKSKSGFTGIEKDVIEANGGKIILFEDIQGFSTTKLLQKIREVESKEKEMQNQNAQ